MSDDKNSPENDTENGDVAGDTSNEPTQDEPEDDSHTSLSSRVLKGLFLIFIGCGIALWGAPKLAPLLPQGLAPVAEFLMPGQSAAKAEVVALRSEVADKFAELSARPINTLSQGDIDAAIAAYATASAEEMASLKDKIEATDGQDIEARLARLETQITGLSAEVAAMNEHLSLQITENGAALSEEAAGKLSGYQAAIEGLKAQVETLAAQSGSLNQKIDEVATASARRVKQAEENADAKVASTATTKLVTDIKSALDTGASFQAALDGLAGVAGIEPPQELAIIASSGTASLATLRGQFAQVAHEALRADTTAKADDGVMGKFGAFLRTQVGTRSLERREGDDTNAILSRVEDELIRGNLPLALSEAEALGTAPKAAMADWLQALSTLSAAQMAMAQLTTTLGVIN